LFDRGVPRLIRGGSDPGMSLEDREALRRFLSELREVLARVLEDSPDLFGEAAGDLREAWQELVVSGLFEFLDRQLASEDLDMPLEHGYSVLDLAGLTGANLRLKLRGWDRAYAAWQARPRILRPVIRWADSLLGSVTGVIGAAEALKELKEAMSNAYEDSQEAVGGPTS
jgi:hypothetical protein